MSIRYLSFYLTCSALHNDHELDTISLVESSPPLLMEVSMSEVPPRGVQKSEAVPEDIELKDKLQLSCARLS